MDGTVIWDLPGGQTYVTTAGSALLFPSLCTPTGELPLAKTVNPRCGHREAMMPLRDSTRAQNRARYIAAERKHSRDTRLAHQSRQDREARQTSRATTQVTTPRHPPDDDEPPF
jgi:alpha-beta hydrolase superfamily lysophospholipase